jgi:thymidylate synthase ThyX
MIKKVQDDPFIPIYWGKNQKGMQANEELSDDLQRLAEAKWLKARNDALFHAQELLDLGIHKQITNRLLEPFLWHTAIVSATEWDNFFALRTHPDAQPEIQRIAVMMKESYDSSTPKKLSEHDWHLPLVDDFDDLVASWHQGELPGNLWDALCKISVGRCARVSYLTHDGKRDPKADIELAERLQLSGHMSPFEHVARPMSTTEILSSIASEKNTMSGNFNGWVQFRKEIPNEDNFMKTLRERGGK